MKMLFEQCKQMMYVTDEELQTFVDERYKQDKAHDATVGDMTEQAVMENERRIQRFKEAVEKQKQ